LRDRFDIDNLLGCPLLRNHEPQRLAIIYGFETASSKFRNRRGEVLFIDARKLGTLVDRVHREFSDDDIAKIAGTYHAWRGDKDCKQQYEDIPGFCKSATLDDIRQHGHILTPGRYVGAADVEDDGEPFDDKMARLTEELKQQTAEAAKLDALIWANLEDIGYGV
jgi:type I restriction enzyme M protein